MEMLTLNDGVIIPKLGLGMSLPNPDEMPHAKQMALTAIKNGYRLFDTATMYRHEEQLGEALKIAKLKRDEYFVVTKLLRESHGYNEAKNGLEESLRKLGLDYVDLYLIHTPVEGRLIETWKAFVELKEEGKTRSIGVSNFNVHHFEGLASAGLPIPSINQIELHPWLQQQKIVEYCQEKGIGLMAFCPLVRKKKFNVDPVLAELSKKYGKTEAQILIRWSLDRGFVCIPKSLSDKRQQENIDVFDFSLSKEDVEKLNNTDGSIRLSKYHPDCPWQG